MLKLMIFILIALIAAFPALAYESEPDAEAYAETLGEYRYPLALQGGWLYYSDASKYALVSAMEDMKSVSSINRMNLATGETQTLTGEGARLIYVDGECMIYAVSDFYITENGDTKAIIAGRGVYKSDPEGKNAARLCDILNFEDGYFERYDAYADGVVYGVSYYIESDQPVPSMVLKRVTLDGTALDDVPVDFGVLIGVSGGKAYICASQFDENYEYIRDDIIAADVETGEKTSLLGDREFIISDYFDVSPDGNPRLCGDRIYFTASEKGGEGVSQWSVKTDGSDIASQAAQVSP